MDARKRAQNLRRRIAHRPLLERFAVSFSVKPWGCWYWTGAIDRYGYGTIQNAGRMLRAHRVSWEMHRHPIPEGLSVLHHCDTPCCVNPEHLFLGTQDDNLRDRDEKRGRAGARNGNAKLTEALVREIRIRSHRGSAVAVIAILFSVSETTVRDLLSGRTWKPRGASLGQVRLDRERPKKQPYKSHS